MGDPNTTDQLELDPPVEASAWKNLMFMKDGRSVLGFHVHSSEAAAHEAAETGGLVLNQLMGQHPDHRVVKKGTNEHLFYCHEYSHSIPVPWSAENAR